MTAFVVNDRFFVIYYSLTGKCPQNVTTGNFYKNNRITLREPSIARINNGMHNCLHPVVFILYQSINIPFPIYLYRNPVRDKKPNNRNDKHNIESQKDILLYRKNQIDKKYKSCNNPC